MLKITECPTCGSSKIKQVRRNWSGRYLGHPYTVPNLRFYECPDCGERLYDHAAMQKIQAHRPVVSNARSAEQLVER
jgi:YgiT-type zinc finger domain-containing protein